MLDNDTLVEALNYRFETLSYALAPASKVFKRVKKRFGYGGGWVQWRPTVTAANGSFGWDESQTYQAGPKPLSARFDFHARDFVAVTVSSQAWYATEGGDDDAADPAEVIATKGAVAEHALSTKVQFHGNGGGARALVSASANVSSDTLILDDREQAANFLQDMWVQAANDDGSGASPAGLLAGGAATQILGPRNGSLVTSDGTHWDVLIPGITAGASYLFRRGDYAGGWPGLGGWIPRTTPTSGDVWGISGNSIDRSINPEKLAGLRVSSLPKNNIVEALFNIREALEANMDKDAETESRMLQVILSNANTTKLLKGIQTQTRYSDTGVKAQMGKGEYIISTPWGDMEVLAETGFPKNDILLGDIGSFELFNQAPDMPQWQQLDGKIWKYTGQAGDAMTAYIHSYCTSRINFPSRFARGLLA